ncbi:UNVERIFIED_CONTAM: hypothetical protein FKN15_039981 [Acipenser sinensis]
MGLAIVEEGKQKIETLCETHISTGRNGEVLSFADDLLSGLGSSCVVAGKRHVDFSHSIIYSVVFKCLEPDSLYNRRGSCRTASWPGSATGQLVDEEHQSKVLSYSRAYKSRSVIITKQVCERVVCSAQNLVFHTVG